VHAKEKSAKLAPQRVANRLLNAAVNLQQCLAGALLI